MTAPYTIRLARISLGKPNAHDPRDDGGFIISSWLLSASRAWEGTDRSPGLRRFTCEQFVGVPLEHVADVPHRFTRRAVTEILSREGTQTLVACDPEDDTVIYAFVVAEPAARVVHWVHTKDLLRRNGLAAELVDAVVPEWRTAGLTCTYLSRNHTTFASKWPVRFDPRAGGQRG